MRVSDEQKSEAHAWIAKWRPRLFLDNHRIEVYFRQKPCRDDTDEAVHYALCTSGDGGLESDVEFFPQFWRQEAGRQERILVHELMHIVAPSASEIEVNTLTEILWRAFEATP
jgi:hypothetical protein